MPKSVDGLSGIVRNELGKDPLSGEVFIFINKRCNQVKILLWEDDGFLLYYKRLEKGTFEFPSSKVDSLMKSLIGEASTEINHPNII